MNTPEEQAMRMLLADRDAEREARRALAEALLICIRYADSSADTEQARAALALAAKLP
jgi:hypothetical protein